jgi:galactokinase
MIVHTLLESASQELKLLQLHPQVHTHTHNSLERTRHTHSSEILIRLHQTMESYACVQQGDVKNVCKGKIKNRKHLRRYQGCVQRKTKHTLGETSRIFAKETPKEPPH